MTAERRRLLCVYLFLCTSYDMDCSVYASIHDNLAVLGAEQHSETKHALFMMQARCTDTQQKTT